MKKQKKAFTMIELLVVITIIAIVSIFTYTPYIYYKNKASLNVSTKTLAQSLYLARSMAINWVSTWTWTENKNMDIWLFLEAWKNKNKIILYWYTWSLNTSNIENWKELKKIFLENNVWINWIRKKEEWTFSSWALFYFSAIRWVPSIYLEDNSWNLKTASGSEFVVNISYKWTSLDTLKKDVSYNKETFVIDY